MKYKYTKKSLLNIPYYDEIYKDEKLKKKLFKRYNKEYSMRKTIKRIVYPDVVFKVHKIFIDLKEYSFSVSNNIFCVLNLYSYYKSILKAVPSFNKIFNYNKKDLLSKKVRRKIILQQALHLIDEKTNSTFSLYTNFKQYTNIKDFFSDYEKFMREYTLNRGYHFQVRTIEVTIKYHYYGTKKDKQKNN